mmetsp:Transcript_13372/g.25152  ORF Transcript_13372/g.25152 Transcript_13372/m.25152 type:complete len:325 (-) Transcript_13372:3141-4115(-)
MLSNFHSRMDAPVFPILPLDFDPHLNIANSLTTSSLVVMGLGLGIEKVMGHFIRQVRHNSPEKYAFIFNYKDDYSSWLYEEGIEYASYDGTALRKPGFYVIEPGKTFLTDLLSGKISEHQVSALVVVNADRITNWQDLMSIEHFRRFMPEVLTVFFTSKPYHLKNAEHLLATWRLSNLSLWSRNSEVITNYLDLPLILVQKELAEASELAVKIQGMLLAVCVEGLAFFKDKFTHVRVDLCDILFQTSWAIASKHFIDTNKKLSNVGLKLLESIKTIVYFMGKLEQYDALSFYEELTETVRTEQQNEWSLWHHTSVSVDLIFEVH